MGVPLNSILEFSFRSVCYSQRLLNVLHYRVTNESMIVDPIEEQARFLFLVNSGADFDLVSPFLNCVSGETALNVIRAQFVSPTRYRFSEAPINLAGTAGGTPNNLCNVAAVITKQTNLSGRRYVGSMHLGGLNNEAVSDGALTTVQKTTRMQDMLDGVKYIVNDPISLGEYTPIIYHRDLAPNQNYTDISGTYVQDTARVMRRRTVRVGE